MEIFNVWLLMMACNDPDYTVGEVTKRPVLHFKKVSLPYWLHLQGVCLQLSCALIGVSRPGNGCN